MLALTPFYESEKLMLEQLLLDYFREIDKDKIMAAQNHEELNYPFLNSYWSASNRWAFKISHDSTAIGFVLVNTISSINTQKIDYSIAEFYIAPPFRRRGFGQQTAFSVFNQLNGRWEVKQQANNPIALKFWRTTIKLYTRGNFEEVRFSSKNNTEIIQLFSSPAAQ